MARRSAPEVNAGSMADIAFLLLIFFLVTTTIESDKGMSRRLPPIDEEEEVETVHKERNVLEIIINQQGELLVDDEEMDIADLYDYALGFIDNGGGQGSDGCGYCQGEQDPESSENPKKALISITYDRQTKYGNFIAVQNEVIAAFTHLRDRIANSEYGKSYSELEKEYKDADKDSKKREQLKEQIDEIRKLYPHNISEAKPEDV